MSTGTSLSIRDRLESPDFAASLAQILPKHVTPERMVRVAIAALTRTPLLRECEQSSFFLALMNLSQWGLEPDGRRAHLIPFKNNKRGVVECQVIIDYKGLVELAMRSGTVSRIHSDVVCDDDIFVYDRGELISHKIDFRKPRGDVFAVYSLIALKDGGEKVEVMSRDEVEAVRRQSKAGSSGPWVTHWNEMAKKTVFRRASKWLQLSAELAAAVNSDDDTPDAIEAVAVSRRSLDDLAGVLSRKSETSPRIEQAVESVEPSTDPPTLIESYMQAIAEAKSDVEIAAIVDEVVASASLTAEQKNLAMSAGRDRRVAMKGKA